MSVDPLFDPVNLEEILDVPAESPIIAYKILIFSESYFISPVMRSVWDYDEIASDYQPDLANELGVYCFVTLEDCTTYYNEAVSYFIVHENEGFADSLVVKEIEICGRCLKYRANPATSWKYAGYRAQFAKIAS